MKVEGKMLSGSVEVLPDPRVQNSPADLEEQQKFALTVRDDISRLSDMVINIRSIRNQLTSRNELLKDNHTAEPVVKSAKELVAKLDELEAKMHNPKAEVVYDILAQRGGAKLYSKLILLFEFAKDADGLPTQGIQEVYQEQMTELNYLAEEYQTLVRNLVEQNEKAKEKNVPAVIVPGKTAGSKGK
jgi:hypothetical protein